MTTMPKETDIQEPVDRLQEPTPVAIGWAGKIEGLYRKTKEHAETYPYVWGSYILVYGGFGIWLTYRWRRLRGTEDRVRVLQEKLRKLVETEKTTNSSTAPEQSAKSALLSKDESLPFDDKSTKNTGQ